MISFVSKGYTVLKTLPLQEVLQVLVTPEAKKDSVRRKTRYLFSDTLNINICSDRLWMYKTKGTDCVSCNRKGSYWNIEYSGDNKPHLNLYCEDGVMMTKDHILSKKKGGKNVLENYQPMCYECNQKKGSD